VLERVLTERCRRCSAEESVRYFDCILDVDDDDDDDRVEGLESTYNNWMGIDDEGPLTVIRARALH